MCAIISWSQFKGSRCVTASAVRNMFVNAIPWGPHSAGLAYGNVLFKKAIHPEMFIRNHFDELEKAAKAPAGFGHVRWATHGSKVDRNAHPFEHVTESGSRIIYGHNGIIRNYQELAGNVEVDSQCLGQLIQNKDITPAQGSRGLIWMENEQLYCYRREQSLSGWTFYKNELPFTIVATRKEIINIPDFRGLTIAKVTHLVEGVAYRVNPWGLEEVWRDYQKINHLNWWSGHCGDDDAYCGG